MNEIKIKNIWKQERNIKKEDIINERFNCDIFINDIQFSENMKINEENDICIKFQENYDNLSEMFFNCESLISIDLSNFNTEKVTDMSHMFDGCKSLVSIIYVR